MISFINTLRKEGNALEQSIHHGAITRLRPILMTALVASLGFLPMALATKRGGSTASACHGGNRRDSIVNRPHITCAPRTYRIFHRADSVEKGIMIN